MPCLGRTVTLKSTALANMAVRKARFEPQGAPFHRLIAPPFVTTCNMAMHAS